MPLGATTLALALLLLCNAVAVHADDAPPPDQGTTKEQIAALKLPQPIEKSVLVLPFWDYASSLQHVRTATASAYLLFQREGFIVHPIETGFTAVAADKQIEPGQPLRREDAVRMGKAQKASWVVYGEIKELNSYKTQSFLGPRKKKMRAGARVAVVDVNSGDLLYWKSLTVFSGGTGSFGTLSMRKGSVLERIATQVVVMRGLEPLLQALPKHEVQGKVPDEDDLRKFIEASWPPEKK